MPFGSLSAAQQILVRLYMAGGPKYRDEMVKSGIVTREFAGAVDTAGVAMERTTKRSFMMNQGLFMARRGLFYATLGIVGLGAEVIKMGFDFQNTMQQASVAFRGFLPSGAAVNREMKTLYLLAAETPFQFPDIVLAARRLEVFSGNLQVTNQLVKALTNGLSAMGILTGSALQRASLALGHMFSIGTLNGQVLLQLNRDNIFMTKALEWQYHKTGAEIKQMVS